MWPVRNRQIPLLVCLMVWAVLTAVPSTATERTLTLQLGADGFTGVRDTFVSTNDWDSPPQHTVNYGQNTELILGRDNGENPLLFFDLSGIPANSSLISATLSLYNETDSSFSGTVSFARRVRLFQVLRDWDEGNQTNSPIDASGKHGATGDKAFDYFTGQGTDSAWTERGLGAGTDCAGDAVSHADVFDQGWYDWDATALVRSWVRGDSANYGLVLKDATGYEDDHRDDRNFASSQNGDQALRPKLTVVYNPDVPFANAGPDQENMSWDGGAVTLDGSGSTDRPGGNDAGLSYAWTIDSGAFGSFLSGAIYSGPSPTVAFNPDAPGLWTIRLTVTNDIGESSTDTVALRLLRIPAGHPRIYLTPSKLAALKSRAVPSNTRWTQLKDDADRSDGEMHARALVYQITGQTGYCTSAVGQALAMIADPNDYSTKAGDIALVFDWCYDILSSGQRDTFVNYFNAWGDDTPKSEDLPGWGNYWPRYSYSYALMGLATQGHNPRAGEWLDEYRNTRFRDNDLDLHQYLQEGGGWPEGMIYDWIANWPKIKALEAWATATGENLFQSNRWYENRFGYILLHRWPGTADQWGYKSHPYLSTGDTERNRGAIGNYERIMSLILIERFPNNPLAKQLAAYLSSPPTDNSMSFLYAEEFLWFNPDQAASAPSLLTHYDPDLGSVFMRSDWPDGAADTKVSPTYATFNCGDHFTYHQHFDQNSFTLFKYDDLALDSGVYSGEGLSNHDINYYVRTIAHNTLVVYNPDEDFSSSRPDAASVDGGQRSLYPATRYPQTLEYFNQHRTHYETGNILRYENSDLYTYVLGDATPAYNNPDYNQAMDTGLSGNVSKVSRFHREFVYLRPAVAGGADFLVIFDRVGVARQSFSGQNTKLLFHTMGEPAVEGTGTGVSAGETLYAGAESARVDNGQGRLFMRFLLPASRNLRKVGGRGQKSFWVFDDNYDWHWDTGESQPRPVSDFDTVPYGEWRLELEPADTDLNHNFLAILFPTRNTTAAMPETSLIDTGNAAGAFIADSDLNRLVLFSAAQDGSAPSGTIEYTYQPTAATLHLIMDLTPNARYNITWQKNGNEVEAALTPDDGGAYRVGNNGVLSFTINGGLSRPRAVLGGVYLILSE